MAQPTDNQRSPGFLMALWFSFIGFLGNLFKKSPSAAALPNPVTSRSPKVTPNTVPTRPASAPVRITHQRISIPYTPWVKEPSPLKHPTPAASSPISSTARITPACRSRSTTPKRAPTNPENIFHLPASPFPNISLSGIFASSPLLASPCLASEIECGRLSFPSPPEVQPLTPVVSPDSPSPFRGSHGLTSSSFHAHHSRSPCTPRTPSSAVIVQLDRSIISPTTMSDGSLEVISLGDRRGFVGSPVNVADIGLLPSPWSPTGRVTPSDVWMSVDGMLMNATGRVDDKPAHSQDDSTAPRTAMLSSLTVSRIPTSPLYSSPSALDALGISVFVSFDGVGDQLSSEGDNVDTRDDSTSVPKLDEVRDESRPMLVTREPQTPRKRRETIPSVARSHGPSHSSRATKCLSTPLTKLDNVDISHVRSASSISSMAYGLRLGLFAEGKSMTAIEHIISLLDQTPPESILPHHDSMQLVGTV
ncbi:hypothetical protein J3R82DRAFT_11360 [Butyriboletus roseoflavus]|nr:hypothetical protein J3R82DRAFT_11360 [Butyriboletus roseoflavus]